MAQDSGLKIKHFSPWLMWILVTMIVGGFSIAYTNFQIRTELKARQTAEVQQKEDRERVRRERVAQIVEFEEAILHANRLVNLDREDQGQKFCNSRDIFDTVGFRKEIASLCDKLLENQEEYEIRDTNIAINILSPSPITTSKQVSEFRSVQNLNTLVHVTSYSSILMEFCQVYMTQLEDESVIKAVPSDRLSYESFEEENPEIRASNACVHKYMGLVAFGYKKIMDDYSKILDNGISNNGYVAEQIPSIKSDIGKISERFDAQKIRSPYKEYVQAFGKEYKLDPDAPLTVR